MSTPLLPDGMAVQWLGHATFALTGPAGQRFLIDPYIADNPAFPRKLEGEVRQPGAFSLVLVTHVHFDHFDVLPLLRNDPSLKILLQLEAANVLKAEGIAADRIIDLNTGGTAKFADVRITMVPAVHTSSILAEGQARSIGAPIGYVLRFPNGFTIYNTGDTAVTAEMQIVRDLYRPDLVILPIGDIYTMGPEQAAYALKILQPRYAIGCHWGTWNGFPPGTPAALENEMAPYHLSTQLISLQPGETLT